MRHWWSQIHAKIARRQGPTILSESEREEKGVRITERTVKLDRPPYSPAGEEKVRTIEWFLRNVADEEDLDALFMAFTQTAIERGYTLFGEQTPEQMVETINDHYARKGR
jgi:hypothetical protein